MASLIPYAARGAMALARSGALARGASTAMRLARPAQTLAKSGLGAYLTTQAAKALANKAAAQTKKQVMKKLTKTRQSQKGKTQAVKNVKTKAGSSTRYRYNTTGLAKGFVQASKNVTYDKHFNKKGSVKINEYGGVLTANPTQAVYIAHSIPAAEVCSSFFRAIIKELMRQRGTDIQNWNDNAEASENLIFVLRYNNNPSLNVSAIDSVTYTSTTLQTYSALAQGLFDTWRTNSGAGDYPKEFYNIAMFYSVRKGDDTGSFIPPIAQIQFKNCKFEFNIDSYLTVQNRTLAEISKAGEESSERDSALDIENVPLKGKVYGRANSWRNYLDVTLRPGTGSSAPALSFAKKLVADSETGIIQFESSTNAGVSLKKPPPGYILGFKSDNNIIVNPGEVWTNKINFQATLGTDTVLRKFQFVMGNSPANPHQSSRVEFGTIAGIGLEKMIDTARSAGSPISLGYQITQKIRCALLYKKRQPSNPIINDTTSPVDYATDKPTV